MDDNWREWGVTTSPQSIQAMSPPEFMWGPGGDWDLTERDRVLREHYNEVCTLLDEGKGYERLVTMKGELRERIEALKKQAEPRENRLEYARLRMDAFWNRLRGFATASDNAEDEEAIAQEMNRLLDKPIGHHWLTENGETWLDAKNPEWMAVGMMRAGIEGKLLPQTLSDLSVSYRPSDETLKHWGVDPRYIRHRGTTSFKGDKTWRKVFQWLGKEKEGAEDRLTTITRTRRLLDFRLSVVDTVLFRFEAFGWVDPLAEGEKLENMQPDPDEIDRSGKQHKDALLVLRVVKGKSFNSYKEVGNQIELHPEGGGKQGEAYVKNAKRFCKKIFGEVNGVEDLCELLLRAEEEGYLLSKEEDDSPWRV